MLDRTLRAKDELDWLPPSFKAIRWTVAGTLWTGMAGLLGAAIVFAKPGFFIYGKGIAVLFAGGYFAGDRAAKAVLRSRLQKLARGAVDLSRLKNEADGELVHVRGRVKAQAPLTGVLHEDACVYRRVAFTVGVERWVHEAGVDFYLVDDTGERVLVEVDGARLIAADPARRRIDGPLAHAVFELTLEPARRGRSEPGLRVPRSERGAVTAAERVLRDGDEVQIVGYKSRVVDPSVVRLERETPMRATLRGGRELPLLISPA